MTQTGANEAASFSADPDPKHKLKVTKGQVFFSVEIVQLEKAVDDDIADVPEDQLDVLRVRGVRVVHENLFPLTRLLVNNNLFIKTCISHT